MRRITFIILTCVLCLVTSCSYVQENYNQKIAIGAYKEAALLVQEEADDKDGDELLWRLEAGAGFSYANEPDESIRQFDLAEDIFQINDGRSVFSKGANATFSILTNDTSFPYTGMGVDRIFCCLYKAIDFASQGKFNASRTELNRAAQHQENWVKERNRDVVASYNSLQEEMSGESNGMTYDSIVENEQFVSLIKQNTGFDYNEYKNLEHLAASSYTNAYLSHFCGVFRWIEGDGGRNFLRDAVQLMPRNVIVVEDFRNNDSGKKATGNVWVYVEDGLCPNRKEWKAIFPTALLPVVGEYVLTLSMAFPVLTERQPAAMSYSVEADGNSRQMLLLENMDRLVRTEYNVFMRGAIPREISRIIMRVGSQAVLGIAAQNVGDDTTKYILQLSQLFVAIFGAATSAADTRSWESLPKNIFVQRIPIPRDGLVTVKADTMQSLQVKVVNSRNAIIWVRKPTALAPPIVKVILFK